MSFKIEEKLFLSKAIISNVHSMRLKSRFVENDNDELLVDKSIELALLMLKKRNELFGETVKNKNSKDASSDIDFEQIIEIFNSVCKDCPNVSAITSDRKKKILKILETHTLQDIGGAFYEVNQSDILSGRTQKSDWKANFDWIFTPSNFIKILEGNYKNKQNGGQQPILGRQTASTFISNTTGWDDSQTST